MVSRDRRLDKLFRTMTVRERAAFLLNSWKQGIEPDQALWSTLPTEDRAHFERCIDLMRAANEDAPYVLLLRGWVNELDALYELVRTRRRLGEDIRALGGYIRSSTKEPITEGEYCRREQERRAELLPLDELVEIAIEHYGTDADDVDDDRERVPSDDAGTRACSELEHDLLALFKGGTLLGEQRDTGLHLNAGSFYDWLGEPVPVRSEWGCQYEIFPDSEAAQVATQQHNRQRVEQLIAGAPGGAELPLELEGPWPVSSSAKTAYALLERMNIIALRDGIQRRWQELRCFETVLTQLAATEFNGEDPLHPKMRKVLRAVRRHLLALHEKVVPYTGSFKLSEPDPKDIALMQELMARSARR